MPVNVKPNSLFVCGDFDKICLIDYYFFVSDIDECLEVTCLNSGSCINTAGSFQCLCGLGWKGDFCEIGR